MTTKNLKTVLKPEIHPKQKKKTNLLELIYEYFRCFQGRKTLNLNFYYHIEPFNIKTQSFWWLNFSPTDTFSI
jgi:hypothetical protein